MNSLITCPAIEAVNSPKSTSASRPADGSAAPSPGTGCRRSRPSAGQQCCEPWILQPGPLPPRSAAARSGGLYAAASAARPDPPPANAAQDQHAGPSPSDPVSGLPARRDRAGQRLTNRPAVDLVALRQRPNRHTLIARIASDTFKLLHSRSLLHTLHLSESPWQTSRK